MPERGRLVLAACGQCRRSKIKVSWPGAPCEANAASNTAQCDGERPECGSCRHRRTQCVYSTQPGETRTGALRSENERLRATNGSLVEFLWKLKYSSPSQAQALIEKFDSVESLLSSTVEINPRLAAPQDFERTLRRNDSTDENSDHPLGPTSTERRRPSSAPDATLGRASFLNVGLERIDSSMNPDLHHGNVSDTQGINAPGSCSSRSGGLHLSLQSNTSKIRSGFFTKQACISEIFVCHSNEEFESLLAEFDRPQKRPILADALCEMCAIAATCGQYARNLLQADLLDYWYGKLTNDAHSVAAIY